MESAGPAAPLSRGLRAIPRSIWALGFVSMFMDISSEMVHSLLPLFLVSQMGAGMLAVGIIEGIAEATAAITKVFSGTLSDYLGKRKILAATGYGLAAVTKPLFPLAPSLAWVITARFLDRVGKGIRGAPRDALVGDLAPAHLRGACFGLRQSLDTVGAFAGPLLAVVFMVVTGDNFRAVFWIAVVPAFVAVALLVFGVSEPEHSHERSSARIPIRLADVTGFGRAYWVIVVVGTVLTLARFSEAFLVLRARDTGLEVAYVPLILVVMNVAYAASSYPMGVLSDRVERRRLLVGGCFVLVISDLVLAAATAPVYVVVGVVLWGLHMGITQGLLAAIITDIVPARLRGTAFGIFNLASGVAILVASVTAGALWQNYGPAATFGAGAAFSMLAAVGLAGFRPARQME
jgi:MFS family permease